MLTMKDINEYMDQGFQAFKDGKSIDDNPHSKYGDKGRLWMRGFTNAQYGAMYQKRANVQ